MNEEFMKKIFPFIIIIQLLLAFYFIFIWLIEKSGENNGLNRMKITLENSNNIVDDYERQQNLISFKQIFRSPKNRFTFNGNDAIVFLHIQKTAGTTFERFMVKRLNIKNPCVCNLNGKKRCNCLTPNGKIWLFSRYSTGWVDWACGLHADYTQLVKSKCVDYYFGKKEGKKKKRLFLTTLLRDPVERFISEYSHVARGATWKRSTHFCGGRKPTPAELPKCYNQEKGWEGIGVDQFIACPYNLAFNRQTRMLADLTLVNCYNRTSMDEPTRNKIMLESAIRNLKDFAFFGIKERMAENQFIFERTFDLRFNGNLADWNKSKSSHITISPEQLNLIRAKNNLDLKLYEFAKDLFNQRLTLLGWNTSSMISE